MRLTLLAYLATARPRGFHSRDALLGLLWPDVGQEAARNRLRQALHHVRRSLGEDVIVSRGDRELGIDESLLTCDAALFDDAVAAGRFEEALGLYRGDFLAGFYVDDAPDAEQWIDMERTRRHQAALDCALALASREESRNELRAAIPWARSALALSPHNETAFRKLFGLLNSTGEKAAALHAFDDFEKRLRVDLEVSPSAETLRLVQSARADEIVEQSVPAPAPVRVPTVPTVPTVTPKAEPPAAIYAQLSSTTPRAPAPAPSRAPAPAPARKRWFAIAAVLVVLVSAGAITIIRQPPAKAAVPTVAVLPFVNMSGDSANEYFSDGVTEEILNSLAHIDGLRVAARTSSFMFKKRTADIREVGAQLGVQTVLEGSVRRAGSRIKISAQLVNVSDGLQVWSQVYDREMTDIFAVQEEIARSIAMALQIRLGRSADEALEVRATSNPEAYDLYLRGKHLVTSSSEERNRKAIEYFEQAIARDARFALPYAALARAYIYMGEYEPPRAYLPKARQAAQRALQLDSSLVETRLALANVRQVYDRDWAAAEREFQHAIAVGPRSPLAHAGYAIFLLNSRRFDEARVERQHAWELRRAIEPDTMLPAFRLEEHLSWGMYNVYTRNHREALRHARAALALDPSNVNALWLYSHVQQQIGGVDVALEALKKASAATNGELPMLAHLGRAYAMAGQRDKAQEILDTAFVRAQRGYVPKDQIALIYFGLGDTVQALNWLDKAADDYHWWMPNANAHPIWNGLNEHPRFKEIMKKIGAR